MAELSQHSDSIEALKQRLDGLKIDLDAHGKDALRGQIIAERDLSNLNLAGWDLSNADLSGSNLSNTNLSSADLTGTKLCNTNLSGTEFFRRHTRQSGPSRSKRRKRWLCPRKFI